MLANRSNEHCLSPSNHMKRLINFMANFASKILLLFMFYFPPFTKVCHSKFNNHCWNLLCSLLSSFKFHLKNWLNWHWLELFEYKCQFMQKIIPIQFKDIIKFIFTTVVTSSSTSFSLEANSRLPDQEVWKAKHFYGWRILPLESINILTRWVSMSIVFKSKKVS